MFSFAFYSCQNDDFIENENSKSKALSTSIISKGISYQTLETNQKAVKKLNSLSIKSFNGSLQGRNIFYEEHNFTVNTDNIMYFENENYHSYTFPVIKDIESNFLINLVLSLNEEANYNAYLITYDITLEQLIQLEGNEEITDDLYIQNIEKLDDNFNDLLGKVIYTAGEGCILVNQVVTHTFGDDTWTWHEGTSVCKHPGECIITTTTNWEFVPCEDGGGNDGNNNPPPSNGNNPPGPPSIPTNGGPWAGASTMSSCRVNCIEFQEEIVGTPCENITRQTNTASYKQRFKNLNTPQNINANQESGFYQKLINGKNQYIDGTPVGSQHLKIPPGSKNATHVHNKNIKTRPDGTTFDGTVKMASPADFYQLVKTCQPSNINVENAFVVTITDEGIFAITLLDNVVIDQNFHQKLRNFNDNYEDKAKEIIKNYSTPSARSDALQYMFLKELKKVGLGDKVALFKATIENESDPDINNYNIKWSRSTLGKFITPLKETPCP